MKEMYMIFETPNQHYLFDGNISKLVCVSESGFRSLQRILQGCPCEKDVLYLKELQNNGICVPSALQEIEHPETSLVESYFDNMLSSICLQVTQNCNLRCSYCPYSECSNYTNRQHNKGAMPLNIAIDSVDYYFSHSKNSNRHHIGFYGGEPLLEFDLIKNVVEYVKEKYPQIDIFFPITTNATLLTDTIVDFLVKNDFLITISLDGPEEYHNRYRLFSSGRGSFETVISNLTNFKAKYPDAYKNVVFNSVVTPENDYGKYINFFSNSPVTKDNIFSLAKLSPLYADSDIQYSDDYYSSIAYSRLGGMLKSIGAIQLDQLDALTAKWIASIGEKFREIQNMGTIPIKAHPGGPCVPGKNKLFINIHGDFFPCERVSESSKLMKIGNIYSGIDFDKIKNLLNVGRCTKEICMSCWCFSHCMQCAAYADNLSSEWSPSKRLSNCKETKLMMMEQLKDICFLLENGYNFQNRIVEK